ncbi:hypothetical protein M3629_10855 [Paenibacillus polysaccharolyticus]|uniref:hypothetical protein n=1 Tax=Paenibacillus polysaccharolyticus TaxID=582692 RepID=UPI0020410CC7|nr:hypothetical protein [Paenibacillus polysaccharolyticus]MCM3133293.1 hypothetical protein [Paenibacillus polysaccharolyticus]
MKPGMIVTASMLSTIAAVILLVVFQSLHTHTWGGDRAEPVTASHQTIQMTNDNLVDVLSSLHMSTPIARVEWKRSILTIDLKVEGTDTSYTEIYENMAAVVDLSFRSVDNVEQVLLRVMGEDEWMHTRHLLLAADIRRGEWPMYAIDMLRTWKSAVFSDELKDWFNLMQTELWKRQFEMTS